MHLLPHAAGSRPRLACEILPGGVVAGRSPEGGLPLAAVARVELADGAVVPGLKPGNIADRVATVAAFRRALETIGARPNARKSDLTLVIPDAAVRVLLLDFDTLPAKLTEALPLVRFRLKKLVPFDTDAAMVSFQIMSTSRSMVRVLAVAIPRDVLVEYESVAREAGFEPGAVLPSTLSTLAALAEGEGASLVVNAHAVGVTTAIVRDGILLLHRSVELTEHPAPTPASLPAALFEPSVTNGSLLPLVDRDSTEAEWAAQQPLPEHGRNPYTDRLSTEAATQDEDSVTSYNLAPLVLDTGAVSRPANGFDMYAGEAEPAPVGRSPYASTRLQQQLDAQYNSVPSAVAAFDTSADLDNEPWSAPDIFVRGSGPSPQADTSHVHHLAPEAQAEEIARSVSVAMAFFEDTLATQPETVLSAGPYGADALNRTLQEQGIAPEGGIRVRELVESAALAPAAVTSHVPRGWLAGIAGALNS